MSTLAGAALIVIALRDIVHELFHPELSGSLSRMLARALWRAAHLAGRPRTVLRHMGPVILISIGAVWVALVAIGAALIYLPRLPQGFDVGPGLNSAERTGFLTAVYVSFVMLTSVGAGDITPKAPGVRMFAAAEPILGLVLICAWITWVLSIYPIIARRRTFEREVALLQKAAADPSTLLSEAPHEAIPDLLRALTTQVVRVATDLAQAEITYYFQNEQTELSLGVQLPYILALARAAEANDRPPLVRHYGTRLRLAIETLLDDIGAHHLGLPEAPPERVIAALRADHAV